MILAPAEHRRELKTIRLDCDLAITGGGLAGVCCAITAARAGIKVVLIHDRPVPGGNASSEVRLWILGATSHMGNNNRWAREGGVIDEILVENMYRNPEGNPLLVDALLLEMLVNEPNITLLLNTAVFELTKRDADTIESLRAFCSQNSTQYEVRAPLFCDASGDGVVGFLAGAAFRMGAESREEFGEKFAPSREYGELLGHSLYFYSKDVGRPVKFTPPSFALTDITKIPRFRCFNTRDIGCRLWWLEYGGRLDTVHDTEVIKWELWKLVYGAWNHIKNSGLFPEAANLTLEWVGQIPGKRESRRFEGDAMLIQQDIIEQRHHHDAVSFGGWSIDLHPADGVFSERPGCNQWHAKGVYQIPYRCMYSRNIRNLFLAGRIISSSHVAFGSSRVMATCAYGGQAVGMAAALCRENELLPRDLSQSPRIAELQRELIRVGQHIPGVKLDDQGDLARAAKITASSYLRLGSLRADGPRVKLADSLAMLLPIAAGPMPRVSFLADVARATELKVELRTSSKLDNHTPDVTLASQTIPLRAGNEQSIRLAFDSAIDSPRYVFVILHANEHVTLHGSTQRLTGVLSLANSVNTAVAKGAKQVPDEDIGVDSFEFWLPRRRPAGHNFAMKIEPAIDLFAPQNVVNGIARPTNQPNAWVADFADALPTLKLEWNAPREIGRIELTFDTDYDHPIESVLMGHPENVMPLCVRKYRLLDDAGRVLATCAENHQTRNTIRLQKAVTTRSLTLELERPSDSVPAALFEVRCYER
jgi:hypothetical protein